MINLLADFFSWNWDRFTNPYVISGLVIMVVGVILLIFKAKIAYEIARRLPNANDKKLSDVQIVVMVVCLVLVLGGAVLAVAFL